MKKLRILVIALSVSIRAAEKDVWSPLDEEKEIEIAQTMDWRRIYKEKSCTTYQLLEDYLEKIKRDKRTIFMPHVTADYAQELIAHYGIDLQLNPFSKFSRIISETWKKGFFPTMAASVALCCYYASTNDFSSDIVNCGMKSCMTAVLMIPGFLGEVISHRHQLVLAIRKKQQELIDAKSDEHPFKRYDDPHDIEFNIQRCKSSGYSFWWIDF